VFNHRFGLSSLHGLVVVHACDMIDRIYWLRAPIQLDALAALCLVMGVKHRDL
jgi:hypothetical protein